MDKIYLLLRNNNQTGPHSVEELVQLSLKPTDLIWVEGRSAGWRNPMEVDTLKSYVPDFSQQIINQAGKPCDEKIENADQPCAIAIIKENHTIQKRVKNIFVSLPAGFQISDPTNRQFAIERPDAKERSVPVQRPIVERPDEVEMHDELMAEKLDKRAQELLKKVQAYSQEKILEKNENDIHAKYALNLNATREEYPNWRRQLNDEKNDNDPDTRYGRSLNDTREDYPNWRKQTKDEKNDNDSDTRYSRSLNDIKVEYSNWLNKQKNARSVSGKKPLLIAAILISVVALGLFWRLYNGKITGSPVGKNSSAILRDTEETEQMPVVKGEAVTFQDEYLPDANFFANQMKTGADKIVEETSMPVTTTKTEVDRPIKEEPEQMQTEEKKVTIKNKNDDAINKKQNAPINKKDDVAINNKDDAILQTSAPQPEIKKEKSLVPLTQLIDINGDYLPGQKGDGVNGYKVTMQNNSNQVLKVVAVDVFYYAANDILLNKKTLYFSNVSPGANMILTAPSNKWAVAVNHQLGLVSSEEGSIYFAKQ